MALKPRERMLIVFGSLAVVVALAGNVLFPPPGAVKPGAKSAGTLSIKAATEKRADAMSDIARMKREQEEMSKRVTAIAYTRSAEEMVPRIVRDLQRIAQKANVRLVEVKPQRTRPLVTSSAERVPIEVRFRAPFQPNVMRFFYFVEAPKGRMVVDRFNIASADPKTRSVDVTAQITVFTRLQSQPSGTGQGDTSNASAKAP